jgi:hypothetical protein
MDKDKKRLRTLQFGRPSSGVGKAIVQMLIGIATVGTIAVLIWIPRFDSIGVAELGPRVAAIGLALAAVVELTYTLFTDGPDEALSLLILGLSSFILTN